MKKLICLIMALAMLFTMTACIAEEPGGLEIAAPWVTYEKEIEALFAEDPDVKVLFNAKEPELKLVVEDSDKADALTQLLPAVKTFGNVTMTITVVPANLGNTSKGELIEKAFAGNPALSYVRTIPSIFGELTFIVFQNKVVQFYNDNMMDINGVTSTLFQTIAADVFGEDGTVYYCTDVPVGNE